MWLLSSDGNLFAGKRFWLPPGSTHLLGRTSGKTETGERIQFIDHKSVSRKHLVITVGQVTSVDLSKLHQRTEITIKDDSKAGTSLDGERFSKASKTFDGSKTEHVIKLGSYEQVFKLTWLPVILSCASPGKPKHEAFAAKREQLSGTDINIVAEYVSNETTHAVVKSRNHPIGMQALLQARWMVDYAWLDAVSEVTRRTSPDANGELRSALEDDFDASWPREDQYLPPAKGEPVKRPDEYLLPKPERADVFQDFIFILLAQGQFNTLLPVITTGGGKALLWEADEKSTTEDFVAYVWGVAGRKGSGEYNLNEQTGKGGVVIVRLNGDTDWQRSFMFDVDQALKQRSILQNEFLDLILMNDASAARQPLPETQSSVRDVPASRTRAHVPIVQPQSPPQEDQPMAGSEERGRVMESRERSVHEVEDVPPAEQPVEEEEQPTATRRKWNKRAITKSRFQGFDDFDTSQYTKPASPEPEPSYADPSQADSAQGMDVDPSQTSHPQQTQQSSRKRPAPIDEEVEEPGNTLDGLMHGQAAMKRVRTEAAAKGEKNGFAKSFTEADKAATEKAAHAKKKEKQIDVKAALAKRKEEDEERRRKDEEALQRQMEVVDIGSIEPDVVEMEILVRERTARAANGVEQGDRWDPAWNGRKNFKKFQRQGQRRGGPRLQRVIVPLEEAVKKPYGAGDDYWLLNNSTAGTSRNARQSQSQGQGPSQTVRSTGTQAQGEETQHTSPGSLSFRRALQRSREEDAEVEADDNELAAVRGTNSAGRAVTNSSGWSALAAQSQTFGSASQRKAAGKRPASSQGGGGAAKKARTAAPVASASTRAVTGTAAAAAAADDGLKFRRRKRD
ncbi:hypothetical protein LTR78_005150 [Recurvomyces mirabilis]|uniref:FHA domain-containing protein n=1 Tax=Recurvomyces mirabilis TaxID=574656 RepID=A0AAE0WN84_9PEZI|nr:hypothetical protein LTR78_005150 [Recurvomyces mirabilis]KAK5157700.1 hypothetical protein LTS14_003622 [Recurvomyces mirabilis]